MTVRIWSDGGQAPRQGTWITVLLWLVSLGVHLGYDYLVIGKGVRVRSGYRIPDLYFAVPTPSSASSSPSAPSASPAPPVPT